jgi:hypothetical protein
MRPHQRPNTQSFLPETIRNSDSRTSEVAMRCSTYAAMIVTPVTQFRIANTCTRTGNSRNHAKSGPHPLLNSFNFLPIGLPWEQECQSYARWS